MTVAGTIHELAREIEQHSVEVPDRIFAFAQEQAARFEDAGKASAALRVGHAGLVESVTGRTFMVAGRYTIILEAGDTRDPDARAMARIQDEGSGYLPGGVVRPRYAKYLAIPTDAAKAAGMHRTPWHLHPRRDVRWVPLRTREGFALILNGTLMYVLVRQVVIQPTWYLRDAFREVAGDMERSLQHDLHIFTRVAPAVAVA